MVKYNNAVSYNNNCKSLRLYGTGIIVVCIFMYTRSVYGQLHVDLEGLK